MQGSIPVQTKAEVTQMDDAEMGTMVSLPYTPDPTRDAVFSDVDTSLANFFSRPIVSRTYTWTPGGAIFSAIFNPWTDFFGNSRVVNRINNYNLLRSKLHVRFLINGNGFYYGRLMADYQPLFGEDDVTQTATLVIQNAIQASQRMKVFIDPSMCCSNEIELPFVWYKDGLSIPNAEWANMGQVFVRELVGLKHANAATQPLTITVMVWATDVQLSMPTSMDCASLIAQAGDEYEKPGPVQSTASAVAKMAKMASSLPVIGPYAKATEMAAGAASKAAKFMGWSRPAILDPHVDMHPKYVSDLAPSNAGDNVTKLTVDAKQELTVDPNVIGISLPDELNIGAIAARESFWTQYPWTTARVAGDLLFTTRVAPLVGDIAGGLNYFPACAFATWPFSFWRCKMRYRFQIVASAHHKGRIRVVWDPAYVESLEANIQFTKIIDISEERDVVVEVDWGQTQHFLPTGSLASLANTWRTSPQFTGASVNYNGVLSVYVLNDLATPNSVANNDITVNVFVSAVDLEVGAPKNIGTLANQYAVVVQAGEDEDTQMDGADPGCGEATSKYTLGESPDEDNSAMLVYFGERIVSFRELLKRYNEHSSFVIANTSATIPATWTPTFTDVPFYYGYNNAALHSPTVAGKFSYVSNTLLHYLMPAYVAMRGGTRSKYVANTSSLGALGSLTVVRNVPGTAFSLPAAVTALPITSQSNYARAANPNLSDCVPGAVTTIASQQPNIEVEFPYYKPIRFDPARSVTQLAGSRVQSPFYNTHQVELKLSPGTTPVTITRYIGVAEDFSLFWFQGCPPLSTLAAPA